STGQQRDGVRFVQSKNVRPFGRAQGGPSPDTVGIEGRFGGLEGGSGGGEDQLAGVGGGRTMPQTASATCGIETSSHRT
ncbi:MAG: hypothetical protein WBC59_04305, partial [Phycisphaerae bacterium]